MAKIKSTLELAMERTRNLSLSQEEKDALQRKELADKVRGWAQMLLDGNLTIHDLKKEYALESSHSTALPEILRKELLGHIDPDADNGIILQALAEVLGLDVNPIIDSIKGFQALHAVHKKEHDDRLLKELKAQGIFGTALIPNTDHYEVWMASLKSLKEQFRQKILTSS